MFIRRNMSSNVSYQQLKQYACFKQLAKEMDVLVLKQILPMVVKKVSLDVAKQSFNPKKMIQGVQAGHAIDATVKDIKENSKLKFLMIQTKIYNILKYLFYKPIECMSQLKNFQKLNFFYRSNLDQIQYGGYIYRKDDQIQSIYYLVRGQIQISKCIDEKEVSICSIYEGTFFGIYEFEKNKIKRLLNAQSYSNQTIVLSISLDLIPELFGKSQDEVLRKILALPSETAKIKKQSDKNLKYNENNEKNNKFIKAYQFQRRLMKFSQIRGISKKNSAFGKFVENKSLLFKIKDSNDSLPQFQQSKLTITTNFHKNEEMVKYYNRLNQHRLFNLGNNSSTSTSNKNKQNSNLCKGSFIEGSEVLSSRLKLRYTNSKKYFQDKTNRLSTMNRQSSDRR